LLATLALRAGPWVRRRFGGQGSGLWSRMATPRSGSRMWRIWVLRRRGRSGRELLTQRGRASTGWSLAQTARCAVLVRTVVGAMRARSAVGHQSV